MSGAQRYRTSLSSSAFTYTSMGSSSASVEPIVEISVPNAGLRVGEILAWRCWEVSDGWLYSAVMDEFEWPPGETVEAHMVGPEVGQGIHAFKTRKAALRYAYPNVTGSLLAIGTVWLWGDVIEFEAGWHAQYARVAEVNHLVGLPPESALAEIGEDLRARYNTPAG